MNTNRIPIALVLMAVVCIALVYIVGSFRPLAATDKFSNPTQSSVQVSIAVSAQTVAPTMLLVTETVLPTETAAPTETIATATVLPSQTATPLPTIATETPLPSATATPTQTTVPATPTPSATDTPSPTIATDTPSPTVVTEIAVLTATMTPSETQAAENLLSTATVMPSLTEATETAFPSATSTPTLSEATETIFPSATATLPDATETPLPSATLLPLPTDNAEIPSPVAADTPSQTEAAPTEAASETPVAVQTAPTAALDPGAIQTETSIPAYKTLEAIATRAFSTPIVKPLDPARAINKTTNFLLIGTDTRTNDPTWQPNTDVMMVLFLDTSNRRAALLSLPRDLVVAIPGQQAFRINSAYRHGWDKGGVEGGVKILEQVLRDDLQIRIDHWALIDFDGLSKIVDTLGGIEVNVPCALSDTIDEQAFTIPAGNVQMDYLTAKRYVQSRYTTSDTSRNYRQQRVVWAMAKKALRLNAPDRIPALYGLLQASVVTDMNLLDMVGLVPAVYQLDIQNHPERLRARVLEAPAVYPWVSPNGAWLFMPDDEAIQVELDKLFDAPQLAAEQATTSECPPGAATPPPTDAPTATAVPTP